MFVVLLLSVILIHEGVGQEGHSSIATQDIIDHLQHEEDAKDLFFRRLTSSEGDLDNADPNGFSDEIPQPGRFETYNRPRREVEKPEGLKVAEEVRAIVEKHMQDVQAAEKPEENNSTETENGTVASEIDSDKKFDAAEAENEGLVGINDFIRFRREAELKNGPKETRKESLEAVNENERRDELAFPERQQQRTGRMLMEENNDVPEGSREPRGAVKEQWVKQPYPVHSVSVADNNYDDNVAAAASAAPRVHFVTQRRLEPAPPPPSYRTFEREGRARDVARGDSQPKESPRSVDRNFYSKRYNPYPVRPYNPYRDDPYYRYEESRYDPRYGPFEYDQERPQYSSSNRQRRIIYYATLPEVVRSPPNVNLRDRYSYRDRYDDRYVSSPPVSVAEGGPYRFRKPYPFAKSRYDHEVERTKAPYPLKVSTDVNVREAKKNPERRIYSESDSRFGYKTPYHSEEEFERRS